MEHLNRQLAVSGQPDRCNQRYGANYDHRGEQAQVDWPRCYNDMGVQAPHDRSRAAFSRYDERNGEQQEAGRNGSRQPIGLHFAEQRVKANPDRYRTEGRSHPTGEGALIRKDRSILRQLGA